jgi:hypothetical protein
MLRAKEESNAKDSGLEEDILRDVIRGITGIPIHHNDAVEER